MLVKRSVYYGCLVDANKAKDLMGSYTHTTIALDSNLCTRSLQRKLAPNIGNLIEPMKDELEYAIHVELPQSLGTRAILF